MDPNDPASLRRALRSFDAGRFVERHGGYKESLSSSSHEYLLTCPCGSDRLRWNSQKGTWICWGHPIGAPNRTGDTIKLIEIFERVDEMDAIGMVLDGYTGGDSPAERLTGGLRDSERAKVRLLPAIPWPAGVERLTERCAPHERAWDYLEGRGLTGAQIQSYQLGYGRTGRYNGYIVFPVFMDGVMVYYQARATWDPPPHLTKEQRKLWESTTDYQKTRNPKAVAKLATSGEVLFNYDMARRYEIVIVCEGPVDAIKVGPNAVALLGKVGQKVKAERLKRMHARAYVIYLDRGEEERQYAKALAKELSPYAQVYIVEPPEGFDAGKLSTEQNAAIIRAAAPFDPNQLTSTLI